MTGVQTLPISIFILRVFDQQNPRPDDALDQDSIAQVVIARSKAALEDLWPQDENGLGEYVNKMRPALGDVLNVKVPEPGEVHVNIMPNRSMGRIKRDDFTAMQLVLSRPNAGDQIPAVIYEPKGGADKKIVNLIVDPDGKAATVGFATGEPRSMTRTMLENDQMVLAIDVFMTGENPSPFPKAERERYCNYFSTFSPADEALRVQDILTAIAYLQERDDVAEINLIGLGEAGLWCLLANAFAPDLNRTVVDVVGFHNRDESAWVERLNIQGILRVGGFDTAVACAAPRPILIHNADGFDANSMVELYRMLGATDNLRIDTDKDSDKEILGWLAE